jgi:hypothetical protein
MTPKQLKAKFKCVARPGKHGAWWTWDERRNRQVKRKPWGSSGIHDAPLIGYAGCPCGTFNNYEKMFLVHGTVMHESCALGVTRLEDTP